jgi:urease alpha subunit
MGQATNRSSEETLDLVITNALIIDWSGIFKVRIYILSQDLRTSLTLHNRQTLVSKMA